MGLAPQQEVEMEMKDKMMEMKLISTLILKVDLDCHLCYKKIKKTLCKLQEKERIQSIIYDEKNQTVTISGPFEPRRIIKKICCKACKVIKEIQIKDNKEKPKATEPAKEKPKEKPAEPAKDKPKDKPAEPAKDKPKDKPAEPAASKDKPKEKSSGNDKAKDAKPAEPAEPKKDKTNDKPKDAKTAEPAEAKKDKPAKEVKFDMPPQAEAVKISDPVTAVKAMQFGMGYQPAWQGGPVCYGMPEYYGGSTCGCANGYGAYGWIPESQPVVVYGGPAYETQPLVGYGRSVYESQPATVYSEPAYGGGAYQADQFFCEEGPQEETCTVM